MGIHFAPEARAAFEAVDEATRADAAPALTLLSSCFEIAWFRAAGPRLWTAAVRPGAALVERFGLRSALFVVGHGLARDFHESALLQSPPADCDVAIDPRVRLVVSEIALASAACAAWAARHRIGVVALAPGAQRSEASAEDHLYKVLGASLHRRDLYAELDPVRRPSEFFGRESEVNEVLAHVVAGRSVGVFGLRRIGKSSLLGRVEDVLEGDPASVCATAVLVGNATRLSAGRWWLAASDMLAAWQRKLVARAVAEGSRVRPKVEALALAIKGSVVDTRRLAAAFERDVRGLVRAAEALAREGERPTVRLVVILDECDHLYPDRPHAGYWREDFFALWQTLHDVRRALDQPERLVFVIGGVDPAGVEHGTWLGQPNPLFETRPVFLRPMPYEDAAELLATIGRRMGLAFGRDATSMAYALVGGFPLLLRKLGTSVHREATGRGATVEVTADHVLSAYRKAKRSFLSQIEWTLVHLRAIAPEEERLLRDIASGGPGAWRDLWGQVEFRDTYAHHLERFGLVEFDDDRPSVSVPVIAEAIRRPAPSEFEEQFRLLKELVDSVEDAMRRRLAADLAVTVPQAQAEHGGSVAGATAEDAIHAVLSSIPAEAKNRALSRQQLMDIGASSGLGAVLESLGWNDYELLLAKFYDRIAWFGPAMERAERLKAIQERANECHLVRHNNRIELKSVIARDGFAELYRRIAEVREMCSG